MSWIYTYDAPKTSTAIGALPAETDIQAQIASARSSAITLINSGNYGPVGSTYRVTIRGDGAAVEGYTLTIQKDP